MTPRRDTRSLLIPKFVTELSTYTRAQFLRDATAGVIVGIVALPLAIAFALASGVPPERGLWTAIIAGLIISTLGGSRVQIGGPTGAFVVIVYGIVQQHGLDGLAIATIMAGVLLVIFGLAKFGTAIRFIPHPVITGFTSGIAVIIFSGEIKDFFGLEMGAVPPDFVGKWNAFAHATGVNPTAMSVALLALAIIVVWPRINQRIPGPFVALIATTVLVKVLELPVETIGSRFGQITASFPAPQLPSVMYAGVVALVGPAFTIALLCAVESLLSAVVADGMVGGRHRSNMELIAQGAANIVTPLFGGIPATGAIARTATNVKNGGRTPVAGIIHAITLLVITLAAGRWAGLIPMATLAAILVVVAYHMSEWRTFRAELRSPKSDVAVLLATFSLTVLVDLTVAIAVGMVLAAFLFIRQMAGATNISHVTAALAEDDDEVPDANATARRTIPKGVEVYEITGPFFFGAVETFKDTIARVARKPPVLIVRMRNVLTLDSTGIHALKDVAARSRSEGTLLLLAEVHMQPLVALTGSAALDVIGREHLFANLDDALNFARRKLGVPEEAPPEGVEPTVERERTT
ncbi:MAG TPA: SulP family inorganic anion transporter [Gemmatimonadaceae bacterium]|nr:SulP family inorganic anion transporter [Gemmatimonadaceae bacterium]